MLWLFRYADWCVHTCHAVTDDHVISLLQFSPVILTQMINLKPDDKFMISVITGDKISTFSFKRFVGKGSSTHDVVGQLMMTFDTSVIVVGKKE